MANAFKSAAKSWETPYMPGGRGSNEAPDPSQFQDYGQYRNAWEEWNPGGTWSNMGNPFSTTGPRYTPAAKTPAVTEQGFYGNRVAAQGPQVLGESYNAMSNWAKGGKTYEDALRNLIENPNAALENFAPFTFMREQGVNQAKRRAAARGMLGSGNLLGELTELGTGIAGQNFFRMAEMLNQLASGRAGGYESLAGIAQRGQGLGIQESDVINTATARNRTNALGQREMALREREAASAEQGARDAMNWLMSQYQGGGGGGGGYDMGESGYYPEPTYSAYDVPGAAYDFGPEWQY